jgi:hypothetical protein
MKLMLAVLVSTLFIVTACEKLNSDKKILADDVANNDRGAKAAIEDVLFNTDIGITLADTSRFGRNMITKFAIIKKDTLDTLTNTWHCSASHVFGNDTIIARYWVRYATNLNGYLIPLLTDTAYISNVIVNDTIIKDNSRIYITVDNTSDTITGLRDWVNPNVSGALTFNGRLQVNIHFAVNELTPQTNDDLHYYNSYSFKFVNLRITEGSTVPSSGSVNFTIDQNLDPDKDGLNGTILGDYSISGVLTFSASSSHTLTLVYKSVTYSYSVTIDSNRNITINPL